MERQKLGARKGLQEKEGPESSLTGEGSRRCRLVVGDQGPGEVGYTGDGGQTQPPPPRDWRSGTVTEEVLRSPQRTLGLTCGTG